ncbi:hypothetical protein OB919_17125 [Halobacteria archaeon AArc-curdl1]|uniref:DUF4129 domain-containing protein n=1 Tax=Natronosalvus hydrolyticus TaxID=2979988 RepID=A0AAP3E8Y7_9EURY|nr:hypothetical protein [Halobacteria archaeon AArc-curdl1]
MNDRSGRVLILVCVLCLVALPVSGVALGASDAIEPQPTPAISTVVADEDDEGNETPRHQDPDGYDEDGDGAAGWLENRLAEQLGDGAISLSEGEYDFAKDYVGEEYRERLGQYVEVAGETDEDTADDDEEEEEKTTEEAFEEAAEKQERLATLLEEYEELFAEYEEAIEAGDEARAREIARELEVLADEIAVLADELDETYDLISVRTDIDFTDAKDAISQVNESTQQQQSEVRDAVFVQTQLSVEADAENVSYVDPLQATGTIETADNSTIANETIRLVVDGEPQTVETDANGSFTFDYQPAADKPLSTETVPVQYEPATNSTYLGSSASLPVSIHQLEPTISALETTDTVAYDERLSVSADVLVSDEPVNDVSVTVTLGDETLGELPVENGSVDGTVRVPASVPAGEHTLEVSLPMEDRALANASASTDVTVTETETALSLEGSHDGETLSLQGELGTIDGASLEGYTVTILVDGEPAETVTTEAEGVFSAAIPLETATADTVTVGAHFEGEGTNLAETTGTTDVQLTASAQPATDGDPLWTSPLLWVGVGVLTLLALGAGVWWWRRDPDADSTSQPEHTPTPEDTSTDHDESAVVSQSLLADARSHLSNGRPDAAVRTGYGAVRRALADADSSTQLTHWEFFNRYRGDPPDEPLQTMTETYEQAVYTPEGVPSDDAKRALECAQQLCGVASETESPVTADD